MEISQKITLLSHRTEYKATHNMQCITVCKSLISAFTHVILSLAKLKLGLLAHVTASVEPTFFHYWPSVFMCESIEQYGWQFLTDNKMYFLEIGRFLQSGVHPKTSKRRPAWPLNSRGRMRTYWADTGVPSSWVSAVFLSVEPGKDWKSRKSRMTTCSQSSWFGFEPGRSWPLGNSPPRQQCSQSRLLRPNCAGA